jgi:tRNA(fMet)-specific endonuclease VapC
VILYLLDTNVVSEPIKPKPRPGLLRKLLEHEDEVAIPSIVWHELRYGMARLPESRRRTAIASYLNDVVRATMPILDYDELAAEVHAAERARLAARGDTPPFADSQIAAIAQTNDLTLVTFNEVDFRRFEDLRIVIWR